MAASPQWSLRHHPVFSRFTPFRGEIPAHYAIDFLGAKIRRQFVAGLPVEPTATFTNGFYPVFDEEYFEWIDLLESVANAKDSFTMIELGAGFGRWAVRAGRAMEQHHPRLPYRLIAVEAEPQVFEWMQAHFADNGIDPARHSLIHAAVCGRRGDALFYVGGPRGSSFDCPPDQWYGQALTKDYDCIGKSSRDGKYKGFHAVRHESGWRSIRVPTISLIDILEDLQRVDLVDMDIEGQELPEVWSAIEELNRKVKRLHIGTHGKDIEAGLRQLLHAHGWRCLADYSVFSTTETPWGPIHFGNGVQTWLNPRL